VVDHRTLPDENTIVCRHALAPLGRKFCENAWLCAKTSRLLRGAATTLKGFGWGHGGLLT